MDILKTNNDNVDTDFSRSVDGKLDLYWMGDGTSGFLNSEWVGWVKLDAFSGAKWEISAISIYLLLFLPSASSENEQIVTELVF